MCAGCRGRAAQQDQPSATARGRAALLAAPSHSELTVHQKVLPALGEEKGDEGAGEAVHFTIRPMWCTAAFLHVSHWDPKQALLLHLTSPPQGFFVILPTKCLAKPNLLLQYFEHIFKEQQA